MHSFFSTKNWNLVFIYALFICSTFSIAGIEASILILYLTFLISFILNRQYKNFNKPLFWAILYFIIISVFSGLFNEYETEHLMALRTNWRLILPLILAVILKDVNEERLLYVFFVFVMLMSIYGIIQFFTGVDWFRPDSQNFTTPYNLGNIEKNIVFHGKGNFSHHLTFGGYLLLCFSLLSSLIFCKEFSPFSKIICILITIIILLAITSSLGRSVWLGTIVVISVLIFRISPKVMFTITICLLAIGSYLFIQFSDPSFEMKTPNSRIELVQKRIISSFKIQSNQDRILMWETGISAINDHFWLGIGYGNDVEIMPSYRKEISNRTGHRFWTKPGTGVHNIYLQTWVNYGLLGLIGYTSIFVIFLAQSIITLRKTSKYSYENSILWAGISGICGFMVAGFFENNFRDGEVQAMLLILMGLSLRQIQKLKERIF